MPKLIIASHGSLATGMHSAAKMILNRCDDMFAFGLDTYEDPEMILKLVREMVENEPNSMFYILCDIKGGSVHNQLMQLLPYPNARLLTGVNLSMVLTLATAPEQADLDELTEEAVQLSRSNIMYCDRKKLVTTTEIAEEDALW